VIDPGFAHISRYSHRSKVQLAYRFDPGSNTDGVTLTVPLPLVNQVSPQQSSGWSLGLLEELLVALLRGLPKQLRRALVPIPETARRLAERLVPSERPLVQAVVEALKEITGVSVSEDAWDGSAVPGHLRMKFCLVDNEGHQLALEEDFSASSAATAGRGQQVFFAEIPSRELERTGIRRWDFDMLPESLDLDHGGIRLRGYPALVDRGDSAAIRVLDSEAGAALAMREGLRRLERLGKAP